MHGMLSPTQLQDLLIVEKWLSPIHLNKKANKLFPKYTRNQFGSSSFLWNEISEIIRIEEFKAYDGNLRIMMQTSETNVCVPTYKLYTLRVHRKRSSTSVFGLFPTYAIYPHMHTQKYACWKPTYTYVGYSPFTATRNSSVQSCQHMHAILWAQNNQGKNFVSRNNRNF